MFFFKKCTNYANEPLPCVLSFFAHFHFLCFSFFFGTFAEYACLRPRENSSTSATTPTQKSFTDPLSCALAQAGTRYTSEHPAAGILPPPLTSCLTAVNTRKSSQDSGTSASSFNFKKKNPADHFRSNSLPHTSARVVYMSSNLRSFQSISSEIPGHRTKHSAARFRLPDPSAGFCSRTLRPINLDSKDF